MMAVIAAYDDVKSHRRLRQIPGGYSWRTDFLYPGEDSGEIVPQAYLVERDASGIIPPHYHTVDQFQVIVRGGGTLGRHDVSLHGVHFARAHTPYGPIIAGEQGIGFLTLRASPDPNAYFIPECAEQLKRVANRNPWQTSERPQFDAAQRGAVHAFSHIKDERGLAAYALTLAPNATMPAPDPGASGGQYLIITRGTLLHEEKSHDAVTVVFVRPHERSFPLKAGEDGLEALVLNFPRQVEGKPAAIDSVKKVAAGFQVWQCQLCEFVYDESKGMPDEGVPPGTRWADVPQTWTCPDCSSAKSDFQMASIG